jgi:protein-histidine pros-kinase
MGLRLKFNLVLLILTLVGVGLSLTAATAVLNTIAKDEVVQNSRLLMENATGARKYTSEEIAPILERDMNVRFHPQAVSSYAAKKMFEVLHSKMSDYSYREAVLNPTNLEDRASDWESDIINNEFRNQTGRTEFVTERDTPTGRMLYLAKPISVQAACLTCHSTPAAAPKSMIAIYGPRNGFGWKLNEVVGAQIVTVPMSVALARSSQVRATILAPLLASIALVFVLLNIMLDLLIIRPIDKMTKAAEQVSLGATDAPELIFKGDDQIAKLGLSFNRMQRSLREALKLLS